MSTPTTQTPQTPNTVARLRCSFGEAGQKTIESIMLGTMKLIINK